jgi:hypothetical protein
MAMKRVLDEAATLAARIAPGITFKGVATKGPPPRTS